MIVIVYAFYMILMKRICSFAALGEDTGLKKESADMSIYTRSMITGFIVMMCASVAHADWSSMMHAGVRAGMAVAESVVLVPPPPSPDPYGPDEGFQCDDQGVDTYGLHCSRCNGGSRNGEPCISGGDCPGEGGGSCVAHHTVCAGGSCNIPMTWPKNRFIGFGTPVSLVSTIVAVRVKIIDLDGFPKSNGEVRWVGSPSHTCEGGACSEVTKFWSSGLGNTPQFMDWSTSNVVQIYGEEVIPSSRYAIQFVDLSCVDLNDENCYSTALMIETAKWGDAKRPLYPFTIAAQPSISDVLAIIDKWLGWTEPRKSRSLLQPGSLNPNSSVGIADVLKGIDAWLGTPYPYNFDYGD